MRQVTSFCIKCVAFGISVIVLAYVCDALFLYKSKAYMRSLPGYEIYVSILKSKRRTTKRKLIIGDSTANQFFGGMKEEEEEEYYSLTCNQAVSMCGQYLLLNNYLKAGNRPEEVYLIYHPLAMGNNLDEIFTYHYFLKPFYRREYKPLMTANVMRQIRQIPFYRFSQFPLLISSAWAPDYSPERTRDSFLSPVSIEYLEKMDSLRAVYGFRLYCVPSLVAEGLEKTIRDYNLNGVANNRTRNALQIYLDSIHYIPDSNFSDNIHLRHPLEYRGVILDNMKGIKRAADR